jgi:predicted transposase YbfD/YdcC
VFEANIPFGKLGHIYDSDWNNEIKIVVKITRKTNHKVYVKDKITKKTKQVIKPTTEIAYYICTKPKSYFKTKKLGKRLSHIIRTHWNIENKNHYTRDERLGEDKSRIRINSGAIARIRSIVINIFRFTGKTNIKGVIEENAWNQDKLRDYKFLWEDREAWISG